MVVLQNQFIFAKKCHLHWIADRANIICKYITYTFFQFWAWLLRFLCYVVSKSCSLLWKKKLNNFCCIVILFVWAQKSVSQIFEILFQTGDINIFVLLGVFISICSTKKLLSRQNKHQWWNLRHFNKESVENSCGKVLKENSIIARGCGFAKLFIMQNYTVNPNGNVTLMVENVWYF